VGKEERATACDQPDRARDHDPETKVREVDGMLFEMRTFAYEMSKKTSKMDRSPSKEALTHEVPVAKTGAV